MRILTAVIGWISRHIRALRRLHGMATCIDLIILLQNVAILAPEIETHLSPHHSVAVAVTTDQQQAPSERGSEVSRLVQ